MFARILLIVSFLLLLASIANSDDLYKIKISSENNAQALRSSGVEPVLRTNDGYLVILNKEKAEELIGAGVETKLLAYDISREQLAIDNRLDRKNVDKFPVLYEEGNLRLFRADIALSLSDQETVELAPLPGSIGKIEYVQSPELMTLADRGGLPLDSLIDLINQDSLYSYTFTLQNFGGRLTGTAGNYASRDWIADKLRSFGYDSVVYDSFMASIYGVQTACQNVVAVKVGTLYPDHQIIVGAHRDAVRYSPGADDNGSGTAGVLEIARILSGLNTDLTFKFILFDAEEQGLYGSYHYANEAYARGDSIVYMCNMDMIGFYQNNTQVKLYHGSKLTQSQLWQRLADSLGLVTGVLSGTSGASDHYPFTQKGYDATLVIEYIFSNVYHTTSDIVDSMGFEYMSRLVKASLATIYRINTSYQPSGALIFSYPDGIPSGLIAFEPTSINISIENTYGAIPRTASCTLLYSLNEGTFQMAPVAQIDPINFQATLPGFQCLSRLRYYFTILDTLGRTFYGPIGGLRHLSIAADHETIKLQDNFESDQGWTISGTATNGQWARGIPNGNGSDGVPISDYDGSGQCYLTGQLVGSNVDNGSTVLTSPLFDLSGGNGRISYARWYSNNTGINPLNDIMTVYISNNDGFNWSIVESIGPTLQASGGWYEYSFWVNNIITPSSQMRLKFEVSDAGSSSVIEAALDKILITSYKCGTCSDVDNNGRINLLDVSYILNYLYRGGASPNPLTIADVDGNGTINLLDIGYLIDFLYRGGQEPQCP